MDEWMIKRHMSEGERETERGGGSIRGTVPRLPLNRGHISDTCLKFTGPFND